MRTCQVDEAEPPPRLVYWRFVCDGDHGLFVPAELTFTTDGSEFGWPKATAAGWSIVPERDLCPACVKRRPAGRKDDDD